MSTVRRVMLLCFTAVFLLFPWAGCAAPDAPPETDSLMFWTVTDGAGNTLYLFGSIHVADERAYPLPDAVLRAFDTADFLAVEADLTAYDADSAMQYTVLSMLLYTNGDTIGQHVPDRLLVPFRTLFQSDGSYMPMMEQLRPAYWLSQMDALVADEAKLDAQYGLDQYFLDRAYQTEKPVRELESVIAQMEMLTGFSDDVYAMLFQDYLDAGGKADVSAAAQELLDLYAIWLNGDAAALAALCEDIPEDAAAQAYNDAMVIQRNAAMLQLAETWLASGETAFLVAGAAHMVGADGLVQGFLNNGCTVTPYTAEDPS